MVAVIMLVTTQAPHGRNCFNRLNEITVSLYDQTSHYH